MKSSPKFSRAARQDKNPAEELTALLHQIVDSSESPERLIELYYWSLEEDLVEVMRLYINLPVDPRNALRAFLSTTADSAESIRVSVTNNGGITLSSAIAAEQMNRIAAKRIPKSDPVH